MVRDTAIKARDLANDDDRKAKINELASFLDTTDANDRVNAILARLQNGQLPTAIERQILDVGKDLF